MFFRQLFNTEFNSFTYLLADLETSEAIIIDPCLTHFQRDYNLIQDLKLKLKYLLETHIHEEHITSSTEFRKSVPDLDCLIGEQSKARFGNLIYVKENDFLTFGKYQMKVIETPGHTMGCVSYVMKDESIVFTGDSLLIRNVGRTDYFQCNGSASKLFDSIQKLYKLPNECIVYPCHDSEGINSTTIGEEKKFNPWVNEFQTKEKFCELVNKMTFEPIDAKVIEINLHGGKMNHDHEHE